MTVDFSGVDVWIPADRFARRPALSFSHARREGEETPSPSIGGSGDGIRIDSARIVLTRAVMRERSRKIEQNGLLQLSLTQSPQKCRLSIRTTTFVAPRRSQAYLAPLGGPDAREKANGLRESDHRTAYRRRRSASTRKYVLFILRFDFSSMPKEQAFG
ncbi:hypothetical protein [Methylosinus sp. RM1]|uniref:hypothetical protein n=1 Tax=Methylosinus sp. RM1 TaxID=2583817 RepID=UPI0014076383|nr:hypothetical protein [Methylosinus sp. RM1]